MYDFDLDTAEELAARLADNIQQRRLEKGLSRAALSRACGVPAPTIAKFEQEHTISLLSFISIAKELGYSDEIKSLLSEPKFSTIEELDLINKNKNRKRGRDEKSR
ncbi:MAG: helix-turn-helix transcriptional regulator [Rikenellaceae bacterium]